MTAAVTSLLGEYQQAIAQFQVATRGAYPGPSMPVGVLHSMAGSVDGLRTAELVDAALVVAGRGKAGSKGGGKGGAKGGPGGLAGGLIDAMKEFAVSVSIKLGAESLVGYIREVQEDNAQEQQQRDGLARDAGSCADAVDDIVHVSGTAVTEIIGATVPFLNVLSNLAMRQHPLAAAMMPAIATVGGNVIEQANRNISSTLRERDSRIDACFEEFARRCEQRCEQPLPRNAPEVGRCEEETTKPVCEPQPCEDKPSQPKSAPKEPVECVETPPKKAPAAPAAPAAPPPATAPAATTPQCAPPAATPAPQPAPAPVPAPQPAPAPVTPAAATPAPPAPHAKPECENKPVPSRPVAQTPVPQETVPQETVPPRVEQPVPAAEECPVKQTEVCEETATSEKECVEEKTQQVAEVEEYTQQEPEKGCIGVLGAVGIGIAIIGIGVIAALAWEIFGDIESPVPDAEPEPPAPPAPEPPAPPAPEPPAAPPAPAPGPDGLIPPPQELAEVKEPPPPPKKLAMTTAAAGADAGAPPVEPAPPNGQLGTAGAAGPVGAGPLGAAGAPKQEENRTRKAGKW